MSHRLKITLPDPLMAQLDGLAAASGEAASRVVTHLVREGLSRPQASRPARASSLSARHGLDAAHAGASGSQSTPWLEPYGGDRQWRAWMWGAVVALRGRYPRELESLKDGWWESDAHIEVLAAFAVWRHALDDEGVDPREELAFHLQLSDYAGRLRREGGGVARAWKPGAPPAGWAS